MGYVFNPFINNLDAKTSKIDELDDVDTSTDAPEKNEVLKYNGTTWVPATYDATFTFSIASFTDNQSTLYLIGSGTWKEIDDLTFGATYNNGPPTVSTVNMSINGAAYNSIGSMNSPDYLAGANYSGVSFPSRDQYLRFQLSGTDGTDTSVSTESAIYFRNYIRYGVVSGPGTYTSTDINALAGTISNDQTRSVALNSTAGSYLLFAFPAAYTDLNAGGFIFNSVRCPFESKATVSVINGSNFTENYDVYRSTSTGLGNSTLITYTSDQTIDPLYRGLTIKADTFLEADIEGAGANSITTDNTQSWPAITAGAGSYLFFGFPTRLGSVAFWVGGFEGGFEAPEEVEVTNVNGYAENYFAWRSTNAGLGETTVETKAF